MAGDNDDEMQRILRAINLKNFWLKVEEDICQKEDERRMANC